MISGAMEVRGRVEDEAQYREVADKAIETLAALVVVIDARGCILRVNRAVEELSGWSRDELVGRDYMTAFLPSDRTNEGRAVLAAAVRGDLGRRHINHRISQWVTRAGERRDIAWSNTGIWGEDGELQCAIGTGIDITDQLAADRRLRHCLDVIPEGVSVLDAVREGGRIVDFTVRYLNAAAARMAGPVIPGVPMRAWLRSGGADLFAAYVDVVEDDRPAQRRTDVLVGDRLVTFELSATKLDDGLVVTFRDATESRVTEDRLAFAATHDSLTGLANRPLLLDRLEHALVRRPHGVGTEMAVLFMDLDGFKAVNDELGHQAGDATLVAVARAIEAAVRPADTVARFGGDEFVIVAEDSGSSAEVGRLAGRIEFAIGEITAGSLRLRASVGVAVAVPGDNADSLLRRADEAMYRRKHSGRVAPREANSHGA